MKFVRLLIPTILILVICVISYNTYNKAKTVSNKPLSVIPSHSSILLKINKPHKIFNYFNNKKIWEKLSDVFKGDQINYNLSLIEDFYKKIDWISSSKSSSYSPPSISQSSSAAASLK